MLSKKKILKQLVNGLDCWKGYGVCIEIWVLIVDLTKEVFGQVAADWLIENQSEYDVAADSNELYHYSIEGMEAKDIFDKLESLKVS